MVLFLAGLQSIPAIFYEAAAIDGANAWHRFWRITLPLLMPTMAFVVVITTIGAMLEFTTVYTMTTQAGVAGRRPRRSELRDVRDVVSHLQDGDYQSIRRTRQRQRGVFFCIMVAIGYLQYRFLKVRHEY